MKSLIIYTAFAIMMIACKSKVETVNNTDSFNVITEVTKAENKMFGLLRNGKINDAFSMHIKDELYKNVVNGKIRNYSNMDSVIKGNKFNNIKSYDFQISTRDFEVINDKNVLETIEGNRKIININDSIVENNFEVITILWKNKDSDWKVSYIHSSYKTNQ